MFGNQKHQLKEEEEDCSGGGGGGGAGRRIVRKSASADVVEMSSSGALGDSVDSVVPDDGDDVYDVSNNLLMDEDGNGSVVVTRLYRGKAPIASMDAMEDMDLLSGSNTHLSKLSSDCNIAGGQAAAAGSAAAAAAATGTTAGAMAKQGGNTSGIKYRNLGKTGLKVSTIALGSMKLFSSDNPEQHEDIVSLAYDSGVTLFDVSDPYNQDRAEMEFGRIFRKKGWPRRNYVVCTRVYWGKNEERGLSRKEILESVRQSLRNLQLEYIDLVLISKTDTNCPLDEIVRAMNFLINQGQVMYWGTSRWTPFEMMEAYSMAKEFKLIGPVCELAEYHWFHREKPEVYMAELYNKIGFGMMTWSPISYGLCLGKSEETTQLLIKLLIKNNKYREGHDSVGPSAAATVTSSIGGGTSAVLPAEPHNKIKQLESLSKELGFSTVSQMLIAWCVRNATSQSVVCSAATVEQFNEILGCLPLVSKLTHPNCEDIDKILGNKPSRPPMISTLQQRWAASGGIPPC